MADDSEQMGQDEVEALLKQKQGDESAPSDAAAAATPDAQIDPAEAAALLDSSAEAAAGGSATPSGNACPLPTADAQVSQSDIELLLNKAEQALESIDQIDAPQTVLPAGIRNFDFEKFGGTAANTESATLELMRDVQLDMTIELGRTHMQLEDILKLRQGAVVPLDKLAGDPADIYVNGRLIARGEVLVLNDNFCIRVAQLIEGENPAT